MKKTTQTISIFSWKRIILKGFTNKCNVGTEYLISEFVVNSDWRTFGSDRWMGTGISAGPISVALIRI